MPQLSIYLNQKTAKKLRQITEHSGTSQSRWLAKLIEQAIDSNPSNDLMNLYGSLAKVNLSRPTQSSFTKDAKRLSLWIGF